MNTGDRKRRRAGRERKQKNDRQTGRERTKKMMMMETVRDAAFNMVFSLHENIALKLYFILFISLRPCKTTSREMVISVMMLREHTMTVSICMR